MPLEANEAGDQAASYFIESLDFPRVKVSGILKKLISNECIITDYSTVRAKTNIVSVSIGNRNFGAIILDTVNATLHNNADMTGLATFPTDSRFNLFRPFPARFAGTRE